MRVLLVSFNSCSVFSPAQKSDVYMHNEVSNLCLKLLIQKFCLWKDQQTRRINDTEKEECPNDENKKIEIRENYGMSASAVA